MIETLPHYCLTGTRVYGRLKHYFNTECQFPGRRFVIHFNTSKFETLNHFWILAVYDPIKSGQDDETLTTQSESL